MQEALTMFDAQTGAVGRPIEAITEEILFYKQQAGAAILEIGRRLLEAKAVLSHGAWLPWLEQQVEFSEVTAQRFMRLAREYRNPSPVTDLGASKALVLLALPSAEREEFAAASHEVNGEMKTALEMTKRELEQAVRERKEALEQLEREQQITLDLRDEVANSQSTVAAALDEQARLRGELDAMKAKPVEVAVQTIDASAEQIEAVRKEEAAKAQATLDEMAKVAAAKDAKLEELQAELAKAHSAQKPSGGDSDVATFKLLFDQVQDNINRMRGVMLKVEGKGEAELSAKLRKALLALAEAVRKGAEG